VNDSFTSPSQTARPLVAAGALFMDDAGRVLLLRPTYKPDWDIPGGYVEAGESPHAACQREVLEELGLQIEVGRMLTVDWAPHPDEGDKVLFIFDGGRLGAGDVASITFADGEIAEHTFVESDELEARLIPRLARRIRASIDALNNHGPAYLEHGEPRGAA
jgi:8-oxo-dGTP diphosphatase